jgi:hypothetical protein
VCLIIQHHFMDQVHIAEFFHLSLKFNKK